MCVCVCLLLLLFLLLLLLRVPALFFIFFRGRAWFDMRSCVFGVGTLKVGSKGKQQENRSQFGGEAREVH